MSQDVIEQLAAYGRDHEDRQPAILVGEVLAPATTDRAELRPGQHEPRERRRAVLAVAAAGVMLVAGISMLVARGDGSAPSVTVPPVSVRVSPSTIAPATIAPATTGPPTTVAATTTPSTTAPPSTGNAAPPPTVPPVVPDVAPAQLAASLPAPTAGATQSAVVGDIALTRLTDGAASVQDIQFTFDGTFYGSRTDSEAGSGVSESTSWWTSTDGVDWNEIDDLPDEPTAVHLEAVGGALWVETFQNWPDGGVTQSLSRWDGSEFAPFPLPPPGPIPGEGLAISSTTTSVTGGGNGLWIVRRRETFGVPWAELLGADPSAVVDTDPRSRWIETFRVARQACSFWFDGGVNGTCESVGTPWRIRPEVVDGDPVRIDLRLDDDLVTSVVPPDCALAQSDISDWVQNLGRFNSGGVRTESFVVDSEGAVATLPRAPDPSRPWDLEQAAALDGRIYVLTSGSDGRPQLWATSEGETWAAVPVPVPIVESTGLTLTGDGTTLVLEDGGPTIHTTTDGRAWTSVTKPFEHAYPRAGMTPTDFGWVWADDRGAADPDEANDTRSPAVAVSVDARTWQLIPLPLPAAAADRGLSWSDMNELDEIDPGNPSLWDWQATAHADTIFVVLSGAEGAREIWVGRVGS